MKLDPHAMSYANLNLKWFKDLNLIAKPIKLLKENIGENLHTVFGNDFLAMTPKAEAIKANVKIKNKKQKTFMHQRTKNEKATHRMGENIYQPCIW